MKVRNDAKTIVSRKQGLKLLAILKWRTVSGVTLFYSSPLLQRWGFQCLSLEINAATLRSSSN